MGVYQLMGVGQEEVLVKLVMEFLHGRLFADDSPRRPVSVHQAPGAVDIHCVPGVLVRARCELLARFVVCSLGKAADYL